MSVLGTVQTEKKNFSWSHKAIKMTYPRSIGQPFPDYVMCVSVAILPVVVPVAIAITMTDT